MLISIRYFSKNSVDKYEPYLLMFRNDCMDLAVEEQWICLDLCEGKYGKCLGNCWCVQGLNIFVKCNQIHNCEKRYIFFLFTIFCNWWVRYWMICVNMCIKFRWILIIKFWFCCFCCILILTEVLLVTCLYFRKSQQIDKWIFNKMKIRKVNV